MDNKNNMVEMNEHNLRVLLNMIMSILTDEQIKQLNKMMSEIER